MNEQTTDIASLQIGDSLPSIQTGPISRHTIALYAAGSRDLNPIHTDIDFAQGKARLPDVIVHGMFVMGYLARLGTANAPAGAVRRIKNQFRAMTNVKDNLICGGKVVGSKLHNGSRILTCALEAAREDGSVVAAGEIDIDVGSE